VQSHVADLGKPLTKSADPASLPLPSHNTARGAAAVLGCTHGRLPGAVRTTMRSLARRRPSREPWPSAWSDPSGGSPACRPEPVTGVDADHLAAEPTPFVAQQVHD